MRRPLARSLVLLSIAGFTVLQSRAIHLYPGGTVFDATTRGHSFWLNFLCDLTHAAAPDGTPNPGANFARAAMLVLSLGLAAFFWLVSTALPMSPRVARLTRWLGTAALPGIWIATLAPPGMLGDHIHSIAVLTSTASGLTATLLAVHASFRVRRTQPLIGWAGIATFVTALFDATLYAVVIAGAMQAPKILPAAQKLALLALIVWMTSAAVTRGDGGAAINHSVR